MLRATGARSLSTMRVAAIPTFDDDSIETCKEYGYQRYYDLWAFAAKPLKSPTRMR